MSKFLNHTSRNSVIQLPRLLRKSSPRYAGGSQFAKADVTPHGSYGALLFDQRWRTLRSEIISRDNGGCRICGEQNSLQVHHRQYHIIKATQQFKPPWDYPHHLLITLCSSCHNRGHAKFKVPNILI
jgi:hypothetical protein